MNKRMLIAAILGVGTSAALAQPPCTQQTTRGTWAYTCEGTLPTPSPTATRMLGTCIASKSAYWNCEGNVNLGGQIIPHSLEGQANNKKNCTGFISYAHTLGGAPAGTLDITYVIANNGDELHGLPVNSGGVLSCALRRMGGEYFP